jgi:hypothetical protein
MSTFEKQLICLRNAKLRFYNRYIHIYKYWRKNIHVMYDFAKNNVSWELYA